LTPQEKPVPSATKKEEDDHNKLHPALLDGLLNVKSTKLYDIQDIKTDLEHLSDPEDGMR
jgi:hypothetical protein